MLLRFECAGCNQEHVEENPYWIGIWDHPFRMLLEPNAPNGDDFYWCADCAQHIPVEHKLSSVT